VRRIQLLFERPLILCLSRAVTDASQLTSYSGVAITAVPLALTISMLPLTLIVS
jgi:hypothetical protein